MSLKCILQGQDSKNLVTKVELNEHIADKNNPHEVTAEQVGAMHDYGLITPENLQTWVSEQKFSGTFLLTPSTAQGIPKPRYWFGEFIIISKDTFNDFAIYLFTDAEFYCCVTSGGQWSNSWLQIHPNKYHTNPNLLDNWYFGNPINQRNGYIIPAGVEYNDLSWNHAGTTDKAYPVVGYSGRDPLITINGTNYIVGVAAQVPGYCMPGYTIDRWKSDGDTITITANSLKIDSTSKTHLFLQPIEEKLHRLLANKTVTFSVLSDNKNMDGWYITDVNGFATEHNDVRFDGNLATFTFTVADFKSLSSVGIFSGKEDISISLLAAKLELGDTQTLAHKEGDTWVLNEIPDYGEQLTRCQRYCVDVTPSVKFNTTYGGTLFATGGDFLVPTPVTFRESGDSNPIAICNPSEWQVAIAAADTYLTPTSISVAQTMSSAVILRCLASHSLPGQYCDLRKATDSAKLILSKDL